MTWLWFAIAGWVAVFIVWVLVVGEVQLNDLRAYWSGAQRAEQRDDSGLWRPEHVDDENGPRRAEQ